MNATEMLAIYPTLNERGLANYLEVVNRVGTPEFEALRALRTAQDKCLHQARIAEGTPWISDCLVHGVVADMDHHFRQNPGAFND